MSENELDTRVEQLYRRVSTRLRHDRLTSVWVRFEVNADSDDAMALVRDQLHTGADRGATAREFRIDPPRWEAVPVIPPDQSEMAGESPY